MGSHLILQLFPWKKYCRNSWQTKFPSCYNLHSCYKQMHSFSANHTRVIFTCVLLALVKSGTNQCHAVSCVSHFSRMAIFRWPFFRSSDVHGWDPKKHGPNRAKNMDQIRPKSRAKSSHKYGPDLAKNTEQIGPDSAKICIKYNMHAN